MNSGRSGASGKAGRRWRLAGLAGVATLLAGSSTWAQDEPAPESATAAEAEAPPAASQEPSEAEHVEPRGPHTANSLQLGVGFRYGVLLSDGDLNPWSAGLGLDVGYTLPSAIYLGGNFEYFFGESSETLGLKTSTNVWQLSAEGGYDIGVGQNFVIRPKLGFGVAGLKTAVEGCPAELSCEGSSITKPAIAPGATFMLFTSKLSLSVDVRYDIVLADTSAKALIFAFGIGF